MDSERKSGLRRDWVLWGCCESHRLLLLLLLLLLRNREASRLGGS